MNEVAVQRTFETKVTLERGAAESFCRALAEQCAPYYIVDAGVIPQVEHWLDDVIATRLVVPMNEQTKTMETVTRFLTWMQSEGFGRLDHLVVVGGGALIDTAGLAASLYLRGVAYSLLPTTLVAQVDAAIGGKVGVNFGAAKNSIGAFWHPKSVLIDPTMLSTTVDRDFRAGLAECVKVACTDQSGAEFAQIEQDAEAILQREDHALDCLIRALLTDVWVTSCLGGLGGGRRG